MRKSAFASALLCGALAFGHAVAQEQAPPAEAAASAEAPPAEAPVAPPPAPAPCCVIPAGTPVTVELTEALSASRNHSGDPFGFKLAEPIVVDGMVLVPAGALGKGEVIDAKPANFGGRPGRLVLAARWIEFDGRRLPLQSLKLGGGGRDNSGAAVAAVIAVGVAGAVVRGGTVEYPVGMRASAKVASAFTAPPGTPAPPAPAASQAAPAEPAAAPATSN